MMSMHAERGLLAMEVVRGMDRVLFARCKVGLAVG